MKELAIGIAVIGVPALGLYLVPHVTFGAFYLSMVLGGCWAVGLAITGVVEDWVSK